MAKQKQVIPAYEGVVCAIYSFPEGYHSSDVPTDEYLHVNESGYTEARKNDVFCNRPPRHDFEMFYIVSGTTSFCIKNVWHKVKPGHMVLLKPGDQHNFIHHAKDKAKSHWLHFAGTGAADLLKKLGLWNKTIYTVGISSEPEFLYSQIFQEIRLNKSHEDEMCVGLLVQLLTTFSRLVKRASMPTLHDNLDQLDPVIEDMYNNYSNTRENSDYAKMCNLSVSHFISLFKQRTGLPPLVFRQNIRMEKAKSLLSTTDLPIKEIANMVGYNDVLYFNRLFRKRNGVPPGEYRREDAYSE